MAIRNQLEIDTIIGNGQNTMADLAYTIVTEKNSGRYDKRTHQDKIYRLILLDNYLRTIIDPDDEQIKPYLLLASNEVKLNKLLDGVYKLSYIFDVPGIPITGRRRLPLILDQVGLPGSPGTPGVDGDDALINVIGDPVYDNIAVSSAVIVGIKTFKLGYAPYTAPISSIAIQGSKLREIGVVIASLTIIITSTKGRELITRREVVAPSGFTLSNPGINDPGPQSENIFDTNVDSNTTYTVEVEDDRNTVSASDSIVFVYPFLSGDFATDTPDYYQDLDKLVATKSDKVIVLNGTNKFFFFGYDTSYGSLTRILDQNGFNVTSEFEEISANVNSANLDVNWTNVPYKFYKTKVKTTINNSSYTFDF